jgi:glycosyltransferase involved in cell wall biosynthesis
MPFFSIIEPNTGLHPHILRLFTYSCSVISVGSRDKTWIVLPAYNAVKTLQATLNSIPPEFHNRIILVDDSSTDGTAQLSRDLGLVTIVHDENLGYGGNQKTCYKAALEAGAEVVVMVHPDEQYDARVVGIMSDLIHLNNADLILGNRIRSRREALRGGMPKWRYFLNRSSTFIENLLLGQTIGDFHSGLRAYSRNLLMSVPYEINSNNFAFDQEMLVEAVALNFRIADIPIPTKYEMESSSISFFDSMVYGLGGVRVLLAFALHKLKVKKDNRFISKKLDSSSNV